MKAARVINKIDGQLIVPSEAQRKAAVDGYSLLGKVALPHIRVDEVMHTVTSLMNNGTVQLRLNGVLAGREELLSLDPKLVKSIDFIDNPGIRYGEGIAYVIDIRTQREAGGYTVGADLTHTLTARNCNDMFYAKFNHKNSELSFSYNFSCQDFRGGRTSETADYLLNDGRQGPHPGEYVSGEVQSCRFFHVCFPGHAVGGRQQQPRQFFRLPAA